MRGLIPAHAGKTETPFRLQFSCQAHPRSRGENLASPLGWVSGWGSSPLTRGKRGPNIRFLGSGRLIPAHAGKTRLIASARSPCGAHPRSRGENNRMEHMGIPMRGSSPLTRGKRRAIGAVVDALGLIPAHAGKTKVFMGDPFLSGAHPRSRGENLLLCLDVAGVAGSSPLTRGKLGIHPR